MAEAPEPFRIDVSDAAARALKALLVQRPTGLVVRAFVVVGGGGPRPNLTVEKPLPHERPLEFSGVPFLVDERSRAYLAGARVDVGVWDGQKGFHVTGPNLGVPAPPPESPDGPPAPVPSPEPDRASTDPRERELLDRLRRIYDPEVPMNILDLGLIVGIGWGPDGSVRVRLTTTSPGCPVADLLRDQVKAAAEAVPGVRRAQVEVVASPPWSPARMSAFARRQFGYDPPRGGATPRHR